MNAFNNKVIRIITSRILWLWFHSKLLYWCGIDKYRIYNVTRWSHILTLLAFGIMLGLVLVDALWALCRHVLTHCFLEKKWIVNINQFSKHIDDHFIGNALGYMSCKIWLMINLSKLVHAMAWCLRMAPSHCLNQCWPRYLTPIVTSSQWVN